MSKLIIFFILILSTTLNIKGAGHESKEDFSPIGTIMHHISDDYQWHFWGEGENAVSFPLPIILYTNNKIVSFLSSEFHHNNDGAHIVTKSGLNFIKVLQKVYQLNEGEKEVIFDDAHHPINAKRPLDFSITKNVLSLFIVALLLLLVFKPIGDFYKKSGSVAPKGISKFIEPIIVFVEEDIAIVNIGVEKYKRFMPFLLTSFFFILFGNLLGMIPIFPGGANLTGNIAVTLALSLFTVIITNLNGNKTYWRHILWMPGPPFFVKIILTPLEIAGIFSKPFALMIRLFANITAGHVIVLSLVSLIFVFNSISVATVAIPFAVFISVIEILVAFLQAYVFTMLSAVFIGSAVEEHH